MARVIDTCAPDLASSPWQFTYLLDGGGGGGENVIFGKGDGESVKRVLLACNNGTFLDLSRSLPTGKPGGIS